MIKSGLDLHRQLPTPQLESEEKVIRKCTGTLDVSRHAFPTFRPCNIYLTDRRLLLAQVRKVIKEFRYSLIKRLDIVKKEWLAGKKVPQLKITLKGGGVHFVVMNDPHIWLGEMAALGGMEVKRNAEGSSPILLPEKFPDEEGQKRKGRKTRAKKGRKVKRS